MRTFIWLLLSASAVFAQTSSVIFPVSFPPQLKEYLALSDDQVNRMNTVREQNAALQLPKLVRQSEIQGQIAVETAKTTPDGAVLGPRYAELELIRRDLDALQKTLVGQTQAILGADQKTKLQALQQALALYSTACDAMGQNLLSPPQLLTGVISPTPPANRVAIPIPGLPVLPSTCGSVISPVFTAVLPFPGNIIPQR